MDKCASVENNNVNIHKYTVYMYYGIIIVRGGSLFVNFGYPFPNPQIYVLTK